MDQDKHLPNVRSMYEKYPFPQRNPRDEKRRLHTCAMEMLPKINHYCFRGRQSFDNGFRALVAGGGAGDSAIYLAHCLQETDAEIVYLDMSLSSMEVAKERAAIRKLDNIQWIHGSILELPETGLKPFDYINCVGVLHHMADPDEGLRALASVLAPGGAMGLMVYGYYGRMDIYAIQHLMRLTNPSEHDLAQKVVNTKSMLRSLPTSNWLIRCRERAKVLRETIDNEANLVDAFLHEQDRAYTVEEVYRFIEGADLNLIEFTNYQNVDGVCRIEYDPMWYASGEKNLAKILSGKSRRERQAIAEVMNGGIGLHSFYVSKDTDTVARFDDPENVPAYLTVGAKSQCQRILNSPEGREHEIALRNGNILTVSFGKLATEFLRLIDGRRTLGEMAEILSRNLAGTSGLSEEQISRDLSADFDILNMLNWVVLRHKSTPEFKPLEVSASFSLTRAK